MHQPSKYQHFLIISFVLLLTLLQKKTICISNTDIVRQLEQYRKEGHLSLTAKFITAGVKNL
jgi:hypothetical protein